MLDGVHESCAEAGLTSSEEKDKCGLPWPPFGVAKGPVESERMKDVAKIKTNMKMEMKYQGMRLSGLAAVERLLDEFRFVCENMLANSDSHPVISRDIIVNMLLSKKSSDSLNKNRNGKVDRVYLGREIAMEVCKKTLKEMVEVLCARIVFIIKEALIPCISDRNCRKKMNAAELDIGEGYRMRIRAMLQSFLCQQLDSLQVKLEEGLVCRLTELHYVSHPTDNCLKSSRSVSRVKGGARASLESAPPVCIPGLEKGSNIVNDEGGFGLQPSVSDEENEPLAEQQPIGDGSVWRKPLLPMTQMSVPETPSPDRADAGEASFRVMHFSLHPKSTKRKRKSIGMKMPTGIDQRHGNEDTNFKAAGMGDEEEDIDQLASQVATTYASMMATFSAHIRSAVVPLLLQMLNAIDLGTQLSVYICQFSDKDILQTCITDGKTKIRV